jgi:2',3'-cyclic-nucleotide 2'-phosphodiesterase/3'-nucleotidase
MMHLSRRSVLFAVALFLAVGVTQPLSPQSAQQVSITLLGTTDLHGNLFPIDYYQNRPANRGLAKVATLIKQVRATEQNVLLLDSGDTIQGTPLAYHFARVDTSKPNPTIAAMNALRYDAMAVGNHEFNFGLPNLMRAKREAKFPMLGANILTNAPHSATEYFSPYMIKVIAGVKVAIVGFVTPGIPRWEIPEHYKGYTFDQIVAAAQRVIPQVRQQADLVVVIAHSGLEREVSNDRPVPQEIAGENAIYALAETVPGIDVILFGHTHQELAEKTVNGVLLAQAKNWGQSLARVEVVLEKKTGAWKVVSKKSTLLPVTDAVGPDPEILELARPYHEATQASLDAPIAECSVDLEGSRARYEDHPFVDLIHKVQMEYGKADISFATLFLPTAHIPAGKVSVRQIASLYIYENTLYTIELTGTEVRAAMEHSAGLFTSWPLNEGERPRLPGYNADTAEGVEYEVDLTQPEGARVKNIRYKGKPLDPAAKFRIAVNNYRYSGGGRYTMFQKKPILYASPQEVRELMIEYVRRTHNFPRQANNNWRIVPKEAVDAMLQEAARPRDARPGN